MTTPTGGINNATSAGSNASEQAVSTPGNMPVSTRSQSSSEHTSGFNSRPANPGNTPATSSPAPDAVPDPPPNMEGNANNNTNDVQYSSDDQDIYVRSLDRHFPAPSLFDYSSPTDSSPVNMELWARAPWFDRDALDVDGLLDYYAGDDGVLPGGIPLDAIDTFCWRYQFSVRDSDLKVQRGRTLMGVRGEFAMAANNGLARLQGRFRPINPDVEVDFFFYRTPGEREYVRRLLALTEETLEGWRSSGTRVHQDAVLFHRPQFVVDFRFQKKSGPYWKMSVRDERRARSVTGKAVPYQCLTQLYMTVGAKDEGWPQLTSTWGQLEVPRGCTVESPPVFSYLPEALKDPSSPYWVVAYTAFAVKTACFILQDVYDRYRLWALSPDMLECIRQLDLGVVLGSQHNVDELTHLLAVIDETDFSAYSSGWSNRGNRTHDKSPGRTGPGADYILYDPWGRKHITQAEFRYLDVNRRKKPAGYPSGFDYSEPTIGWYDNSGRLLQTNSGGNVTDASAGWGGPPSRNPNDNDHEIGGDDYYQDDDEYIGNSTAPAGNIGSNPGFAGIPAYNVPVSNPVMPPFPQPFMGHPNMLHNGLGGPGMPNYMNPFTVGNPFYPTAPPFRSPQAQQPRPVVPAGPSNNNPASVGASAEVIRNFLREVGVDEDQIAGMNLTELRAYARASMGF